MPVDDREWDQHHRTVRDRLNWTAVLANGALIVAILSGAMQAGDPSRVLAAFSVTLILLGAGAAAGLVSAEIALRADEEWKRGTAWWEDPDGPTKRAVAIYERVRDLSTPSMMIDNLPELQRLQAKMSELTPEIERGAAEARSKIVRSQMLGRLAAAARVLAMAMCAAGFGWLLYSVHGLSSTIWR